MDVRFREAKDSVREYVEIHYDPIGWQLRNIDAGVIVPALQDSFGTDLRVHCDEVGNEWSTSYDTVRDFLTRANLKGNNIYKISCVLPIHEKIYSVNIDFRKNTIYVMLDGRTEGDKQQLFDPAMRKVSEALAQSRQNGSYSFHKDIRTWKTGSHKPAAMEFVFYPAHREPHDIIVLRAFDQGYHLGTIYTDVWDQERHPWRSFEGFQQYRVEAPADKDGFYEYLDELSFNLLIDEIRYRVWVHIGDGLSLSGIEIEYDGTDHPHDFMPVMAELLRQIPQWK